MRWRHIRLLRKPFWLLLRPSRLLLIRVRRLAVRRLAVRRLALRVGRLRLALVPGVSRLRPILRALREWRRGRRLAVGWLVPVRLLLRRILGQVLVLTRVLSAERIPWRLLIAHDALSGAAAVIALSPLRRRARGRCGLRDARTWHIPVTGLCPALTLRSSCRSPPG